MSLHPRITEYVANNYATIPESGCWIWLGKWTLDGYAALHSNGKKEVRLCRVF